MTVPSPSVPAGPSVDAPGRVSKLWWAVGALLFIAACGLGIGGCAQFSGANTPDEASTFDVPASTTVVDGRTVFNREG